MLFTALILAIAAASGWAAPPNRLSYGDPQKDPVVRLFGAPTTHEAPVVKGRHVLLCDKWVFTKGASVTVTRCFTILAGPKGPKS